MGAREWPGTNKERDELLRAINRNCQCPPRAFGMKLNPQDMCYPHRMLAEGKTLDHLIFAKRIATRLRKEEFGVTPRDIRRDSKR